MANRCQHMNSNAISTMPLTPLRRQGAGVGGEPRPGLVPERDRGRDVRHRLVDVRWGDAFLYITSRYADGYPSAWTVLEPGADERGGRRTGAGRTAPGRTDLNPANMVQISRDPTGAVRGTSAHSSRTPPYCQRAARRFGAWAG